MPEHPTLESAPRLSIRPRVDQRRQATRRELLLAGRKLFAEQGLYDARIEDLTELAGISKGALYLHFRSKEDLIRAVVDAGFRELGDRVRAEVDHRGDFAQLVRSLVGSHLRFLGEHPDLLRVFHQARGMLKFNRPEWLPLRESLARHMALLQELLGRSPSPIQDHQEGLRLAATILFGAVSGSCSVRVALGDGPAESRWSNAAEAAAVAAVLGASLAHSPKHGGADE